MRRGCRVHYCFFNLAARRMKSAFAVAHYLWNSWRLPASRVRFVAINFEPVVRDSGKSGGGQMGVVLKRMMVRAASKWRNVAACAGAGDRSAGRVSSQTLTSLRLIDNVSDTLILRPLISYDKGTLSALARQIEFAEDFARITMPEYCGVISKVRR